MTKTTTTPADAAEWADSLVVRHRAARRPYIPLGCDQQGRVKPTLLDDAQLAPTEQDIGEAIGTVLGWVLLCAVAVALVLTLVNHAPKP